MDTCLKNVNTNVFKWKPFLRQSLASSIVWVFFFTFGLSLGVPTVTIPQLRKEANSTSSVSSEMASWISSISGYVGMPWVVVLTLIIHKFGRRITMMIISGNCLVASITLYCSRRATHVLIFQILHGMTAASHTTVSLMVLSEYSSPRYRGVFLTIKSATLFWGIWVANAIGAFYNYRKIGLLGIMCSVYCIIAVFIIPDSPYWLAGKEKYEQCAQSYRWLKGVNEDTEKEIEILINTQKYYKSQRRGKKTFLDHCNITLRNICAPEVYKPVALSMLVMAMYYFSGKLVCTVYSIQIIKKLTSSDSAAYNGMLILDGLTVFGMYIGCSFSKIFKRRTLLLSASTTGTLFLFATSVYLYLIKFKLILENNFITIALLSGFSLAICCGPMILSSTLFAELMPLRSRNVCFCLGSLFSKFLLGTTLKTSPYIFLYLGHDGAFAFFGVLSTIILILVNYYLPETKDKTLHELANLFKTEAKPTELEILTDNLSKL